MMINEDESTNDVSNKDSNAIRDNDVIMMFTTSLVKQAASPQLRLPANFVGVREVRTDFRKPLASEEQISELKATNDVKFCVIDANGNERRMTKAEKKAKKKLLAEAKKEAKKAEKESKKRNFEQMANGNRTNNEASNNATTDAQHSTSDTYHQLPLDQTTMEQELAEFQGKRGSTPPVILSPPMALQFLQVEKGVRYGDGSAKLQYDHNLSQEWANRLKEQCVLPAEALREKEDLRPLAYRLQPEPWQRLRPTLEESPLVTSNRTNAINEAKSQTASDVNPESNEWVPMTCRPRYIPANQTKALQHDDILSIVFEYIHRETPFYVSCGAKFGSDFLVYDGPRDQRHAFAGLRVHSRFTNSMTTTPSKDETSKDVVELPLPTAYSLTGFVRCLNTAGKLALLATVDEVTDPNESNIESGKTRYRVAFVDVALEKVLDVHKKKNRKTKKNLHKRRDVTKTLSKI